MKFWTAFLLMYTLIRTKKLQCILTVVRIIVYDEDIGCIFLPDILTVPSLRLYGSNQIEKACLLKPQLKCGQMFSKGRVL